MIEKPIKRVLMLADFACATGFAQVAMNVAIQLLQDPTVEYHLDVVGINYFGLPNEWQKYSPRVRIFPAAAISAGDVFGRSGYLSLLSSGAYDITWILQDTFNIETIGDKIKEIRAELVANGNKPFKFIFYYPIDAAPKENWIKKSVSLADIPVVYTQYGYEESVKFDPDLKQKLRVIGHGIDEKVFRPLPQEIVKDFRHKYFMGLADDKFLITNVNRNQPRKDIARTMQIFRLFKNIVPEALLYLHMKKNDVGYNLDEVARIYELIPDKDYIVPANFDEHDGMSIETVNAIYNASDVVITTSLGEGWGLSMTEAMATKTPVIAPNHTALTEILDGRGTLVTAGKSIKDWFVMSGDNERARPLVDVPEYVDKLVGIRNNYAQAQEIADKAYEYLLETWTWDKIGEQWREVFKQAIPSEKKQVIGRNDPCLCGSGKKYKKCHGGVL